MEATQKYYKTFWKHDEKYFQKIEQDLKVAQAFQSYHFKRCLQIFVIFKVPKQPQLNFFVVSLIFV